MKKRKAPSRHFTRSAFTMKIV